MGDECGTKRDFAQATRPFVGTNHALQDRLPLLGGGLDNAATFELYLDAVDQRALVRERLRACHLTIDSVFVRCSEYFLGWHVRKTKDAVLGGRTTAAPKMIVGQSDGESVPGPL